MKVLKKLSKVLIVIILVAAAFLLLRMLVAQGRKASAVKKNEISKFVTYNLNGEDQTVLIEGKEEHIPILVTVHGGPGFPAPFNEGCRGMYPELTESYLTVYWDQLGCGKNRKTYEDGTHLPQSISMEDYTLMLRDLLVNLHTDYPDREVYLFGISWGSILTAKIAVDYPELVDQVLVYGQVRGNMFQTKDVMEEVLKYCNNEADQEFLKNCMEKETMTNEEAFQVEALIAKYTDGFICHGRTVKKQSNMLFPKMLFGLLFSPDYSFRDTFGVLTDGADSKPIAIEMLHSDFSETIKNIKVPYKILQGEQDLQTSRKRIEELVETCNNDYITFETVPNCGHIPTTQCFSVIIKEIQQMKENGAQDE